MLFYQLPSPRELQHDPALAVFTILANQLDVASHTLLGAHPELDAARLRGRTTRSERDAYARVVARQIHSLRATVAEYIASGRRLREQKDRRRKNRARGSSGSSPAEKPLF